MNRIQMKKTRKIKGVVIKSIIIIAVIMMILSMIPSEGSARFK